MTDITNTTNTTNTTTGTAKFLIVNPDEIKKLLAEVHADMLTSSREEVAEGILDGTLSKRILDLSNISLEDLIDEMSVVTEFLYDSYYHHHHTSEDQILGIIIYDPITMETYVVDVEDNAKAKFLSERNSYVSGASGASDANKDSPL